MVSNGDLGLLSEYEMHLRSEGRTPFDLATDPVGNPVPALLAASRVANEREAKNLPQLGKLLGERDAALRRWGALGFVALGPKAAGAADVIRRATKDDSPDVRVAAAEALANLGHTDEALKVLQAEMVHKSPFIRLAALNSLDRMGTKARPVLALLPRANQPETEQKDTAAYIGRMVEYMPGRIGAP